MSALDFEVIDSPDSSLNKTSVLVTGPQDALLVDAGFTRSDGHAAGGADPGHAASG